MKIRPCIELMEGRGSGEVRPGGAGRCGEVEGGKGRLVAKLPRGISLGAGKVKEGEVENEKKGHSFSIDWNGRNQ